VSVERKVLDGNGIGAVLASRRMGCGTRTSYVDAAGRQHSGILVPRAMERKLAGQSGRTPSPQVAHAVLSQGGKLLSDPLRPGEGVMVRPDAGAYIVTVPSAKRAAKQWETEEMLEVTGPFEGDWRGREARVPPDRIGTVLRLLSRAGCDFHYEARYRPMVVQKTRELAASAAAARPPASGPRPA